MDVTFPVKDRLIFTQASIVQVLRFPIFGTVAYWSEVSKKDREPLFAELYEGLLIKVAFLPKGDRSVQVLPEPL
jgi:hypothetical protein